MYAPHPGVAALLSALLLFFTALPARAWVETRVTAHSAVLDAERNGTATLSHELGVRVRGGPLQEFSISGLDGDLEPIPGASLIAPDDAGFGTVPLELERLHDGTLRLSIEREKGLRTGNYVFRFAYRTNLRERHQLRRVGSTLELSWVGPRFGDGLDSARVIFRIPSAEDAPALPDPKQGGGRVSEIDELGGVFVANVRRLPGKDELELVRPHIARGEPALWRVRVSEGSFDGFAPVATPPTTAVASRGLGESPEQRLLWLLAAGLAGLGYALLVLVKWRCFSALASQRGAAAAALLPIPCGARTALAGSGAALAVTAAGRWQEPTWAAGFLLCAMLCAIHHAKPLRAPPRGPGSWLPLADADAFPKAKRSPSAADWLDASTMRGALLLVFALGAVAAAALLLARASAYRAAELLLAGSALVPLFLSGRRVELPPLAGTDASGLLARLLAELRSRCLRAVPLARLPLGSATPDELRLLVQPKRALAGLIGLEVGVDHASAVGSWVAEPFVLVRVRENSPACAVLSRRMPLQRGRKVEERVGIMRPQFPTLAACRALVLEMLELLRSAGTPSANASRAHASSKARSAAGKADSAAKPRSVASPAHSM
jgi:hypothetical protein